jgi:hypothetical protein
MLAKARRNKGDDSTTASVNGAEGSSESPGLRGSMESALDKLKAAARIDNDNPDSPGLGGISKLIPGGLKKKEKRRKALEESDGAPRGRATVNSGGATDQGVSNESQSTLDEDGESSLMTEDSGEEE